MEDRKDLNVLFKPKSVAMIGVSNKYDQISGRPLKFFMEYGYPGKVFPVNPKYDQLYNLKCYPSIEDIPHSIDLVLIIRPSQYVCDIVRSCIKKNVKAIVIYSSGFAETGAEGKKMQEELKEIVMKSHTTVLGPNCMGYVNLHDRVSASFGGSLEDKNNLIPGDVGFLSQSGAFSNLYFSVAQKIKTGFSYWISTGNEMDVNFSDCLEYLIEDQRTKVIACFVEGLREGEKFIDIAKKGVEFKKPIVMLKIGKSSVGGKASLSHTGAMAGSDEAYEAAMKQAGIIRVESIEEILDSMFMLTRCPLPKGNRIGMITITGGGAILMADQCEALGLKVPELVGDIKKEMLKIVPPYGSALNPVDLTGQLINDITSVKESAKLLLQCDDFDVVVIFLGMLKNFSEKLIQDILELHRNTEKIICVVWVDPPDGAIRVLQENGIPTFEDPIRCIKAINIPVRFAENLKHFKIKSEKPEDRVGGHKIYYPNKKDVNQILDSLNGNGKTLTEYEAKRLLGAYGIPATKEKLALTADEAVNIADEIGYPVALKVDSVEILHKTDMGGIKLNLQTPDTVLKGYRDIFSEIKKYAPHAVIRGILVQEMILGSSEIIIGIKQDPIFGPMIIFGMGGIYTEILKDYSVRIAPISRSDAEDLIREIKGFKILQGSRGRPKADIPGIIDTLLRVSQLSMDLKDKLVELDINPLFVFEEGKGVKAGDALMILK